MVEPIYGVKSDSQQQLSITEVIHFNSTSISSVLLS